MSYEVRSTRDGQIVQGSEETFDSYGDLRDDLANTAAEHYRTAVLNWACTAHVGSRFVIDNGEHTEDVWTMTEH